MPSRRPFRRRAVQHEKIEQGHIVELARLIGAFVVVLGTRRSRGKPCPNCGTFVAEDQGTRQTEGVADLELWMPQKGVEAATGERRYLLLKWETKRPDGGRFSPAQQQYAAIVNASNVEYGSGSFDDFIAWCCSRGYCSTGQFSHERAQRVEARLRSLR